MKKYIVILLLLPFLISCNSYKYGASTEPIEKSNLTFGMVKKMIVKNETSQDEILKIFGSPNMITKNKTNNEVWSYNKMNVSTKGGRTDFFAGERASTSSSSQTFDLIISFDDNDVVKDYSVVSTAF